MSGKTRISTTQDKTTVEQLNALNIRNNKQKLPSKSNSSKKQTEEEGSETNQLSIRRN